MAGEVEFKQRLAYGSKYKKNVLTSTQFLFDSENLVKVDGGYCIFGASIRLARKTSAQTRESI